MSRKVVVSLLLLALVLMGFVIIQSFSSSISDEPEAEHTHSEEAVYTCPMHPEIRQNEPGNCPICGMKLVKVENENQKSDSPKTQVSLNVSPYQADLIGIKPVEVKIENVSHLIPVSGRILSSSAVALQVYQSDLRYIRPGGQFQGNGEIYPEDIISGRILSVDNIVDPNSRTVRVLGQIRGNPRGLLPEASFSGQVEVNLGEELIIPEDAVLFTGLGNFAYIYEEDVLTPKKITLGPKVGDSYVVTQGLKAGDIISSGPNFLIDSEAKIRGLNDQSHH